MKETSLLSYRQTPYVGSSGKVFCELFVFAVTQAYYGLEKEVWVWVLTSSVFWVKEFTANNCDFDSLSEVNINILIFNYTTIIEKMSH